MPRPYRQSEDGGWAHVDASEQPDADYLPAATELGTVDTRQRAEEYVTRALGEHAAAHDVPAIVDRLHDVAGSWDVRQVEPETFWQVVREHDRGGAHRIPRDGGAPTITDRALEVYGRTVARVNNAHDGGRMSEQFDAGYRAGLRAGQRSQPDAGCPSWCDEHAPADDPGVTVHRRVIRIGTTEVEVEQATGGTPGPNDPQGAYVVPPEVEWVNGQDAHDFAAALAIAAQMVHPLDGAL